MWRTTLTSPDPDPGMSDDEGARAAPPGRPPSSPTGSDDDARRLPTLSAPDLRGMSAIDARRIGRMSDLHVWRSTRTTGEAQWDRVVGQDPLPGASMLPGDALTITVGVPPTVVVPDVRGGDEDEMLALLRDAGLRPARRATRRSKRIPEGHLVRTRPRAGSTVPHGTRLTYVVAVPPTRRKQAARHAKEARPQRLPDGAFLSMPTDRSSGAER